MDDPEIHEKVIVNVIKMIKNDFQFLDLTFSPIKNTPGNIEYLIYLLKSEKDDNLLFTDNDLIKGVVSEAHQYFFKK